MSSAIKRACLIGHSHRGLHRGQRPIRPHQRPDTWPQSLPHAQAVKDTLTRGGRPHMTFLTAGSVKISRRPIGRL